jgi:hypothetical protein
MSLISIRTGMEIRLKIKPILFQTSQNDVKLKIFIQRSLQMFT